MTFPWSFLISLIVFLFEYQNPGVYFQSERLHSMSLKGVPDQNHNIQTDDDSVVAVEQLRDSLGIIYWYRRLETPVCLTGTCKLIDVGLYWNCMGDFFGLEVYGEHLTKTDHSVFKESDYHKLMTILNDDWSMLREYEFSDLLTEDEVDGVSGATREELAEDAVEDAVYTTYTLWHLAHLGEKEQLIDLTVNELNGNSGMLDQLIQSEQGKYQSFAMNLLKSGKIEPTEKTDGLVLKYLASGNQVYEDQAFRTLVFSDVNDEELQAEIARLYQKASLPEKINLINAFKGAEISKPFHDVLDQDRQVENPWFRKHLEEILNNNDQLVNESLR